MKFTRVMEFTRVNDYLLCYNITIINRQKDLIKQISSNYRESNYLYISNGLETSEQI